MHLDIPMQQISLVHVVDGEIKAIFSEPGKMDNCPEDPFEVSDVDTMIAHLKAQ